MKDANGKEFFCKYLTQNAHMKAKDELFKNNLITDKTAIPSNIFVKYMNEFDNTDDADMKSLIDKIANMYDVCTLTVVKGTKLGLIH